MNREFVRGLLVIAALVGTAAIVRVGLGDPVLGIVSASAVVQWNCILTGCADYPPG